MENILNSNYYESEDIYSSFDKASEKSEPLTKADLFGDDGDNNSSSNQDEPMDEQEYQDVAQEIEDNLIKEIKQEAASSHTNSTSAMIFDENSSGCSNTTTNRELTHSTSFERDMLFPSMGQYTEMEREQIKRKEMKSKKELEEEEREKMQ